MCVISFIRNHIYNMQPDQMCFSRDFAKYGLRTTIDTSLWRLVGQGMLLRVADGVFVRAGSRIPTVAEIAKAKAERFGKQMVEHCRNFAADLKIADVTSDPHLFGTDGDSSSFDTIHGRVSMARVGARKRGLGDSPPARAIRALWSMRTPNLTWTAAALMALSRNQREALGDLMCWMPAWLSNQFIRRSRRKRVASSILPTSPPTSLPAAVEPVD